MSAPSAALRSAPVEEELSPRTMALRDAMLCVSFANCCFARFWPQLWASGKKETFYMGAIARPIDHLAILASVGILAAVLWLAVTLGRKYLGRRAFRILRLGGVLLVAIPINSLRLTFETTRDIGIGDLLAHKLAALPVLAALAAFLFLFWKWQRAVVRFLTVVLTFAFAGSIVNGGVTIYKCITYRAPAAATQFAPRLPVKPGALRVVWAIFDEWDYRLTFEDRPPDVSMPAVDRFRAEALSASDARSPALHTIDSVPAMLAGRPFKTAIADVEWSRISNVFSMARASGFNTAAVGWYLPYCRALAGDLTDCAWWPYPNLIDISGNTFSDKVENAFGSLTETTTRGIIRQPAAIQHKIRELSEFQAKAQKLVADPSVGLVFLHIPVPHQPHPFDRKTGRFDVKMSGELRYFDSLALLDNILGGLCAALESSGASGNTVVLLSSDHAYRSAALIGRPFDPRVPYMIRFPHDESPAVLPGQVHTIVTADMVFRILRGEIANRTQAATWLVQHQGVTQAPFGPRTQ